jgi:hypothetical protein
MFHYDISRPKLRWSVRKDPSDYGRGGVPGRAPRIRDNLPVMARTRSAAPAGPRDATPERRLAGFIGKFEPRTQALIRSLRRALRRRLPSANELLFDNYNFFVIGFSPTERPSDTVVSLAAASNGVGLSFYRGAALPDPHGILLGSGVQNRFIRLPSASVLAQPEVEALIEAAVARARVPFAPRGRGKLVIRSVSKKQRPRRRAGP